MRKGRRRFQKGDRTRKPLAGPFGAVFVGLGVRHFAAAVLSCGNLRYIHCCCAIDRQLLVIQETSRPAAKGAMMNIIIHGMILNTCCCTGSVACGFKRNCRNMVRPSSSASTPMPRKAGGLKSSRPNRFKMCSGSGADRSLIHSTKRSEEHTSELQSLMRTSYAVFCLKKKKNTNTQ